MKALWSYIIKALMYVFSNSMDLPIFLVKDAAWVQTIDKQVMIFLHIQHSETNAFGTVKKDNQNLPDDAMTCFLK